MSLSLEFPINIKHRSAYKCLEKDGNLPFSGTTEHPAVSSSLNSLPLSLFWDSASSF